jgi:hypothetical protein
MLPGDLWQTIAYYRLSHQLLNFLQDLQAKVQSFGLDNYAVLCKRKQPFANQYALSAVLRDTCAALCAAQCR